MGVVLVGIKGHNHSGRPRAPGMAGDHGSRRRLQPRRVCGSALLL
jgi:hypothetical protein